MRSLACRVTAAGLSVMLTEMRSVRSSSALFTQSCCHGSALSRTPVVRSSFHYRKNRVIAEDAVDPLTRPTTIDKGALHVVSVPIGNLKDFTLRALDILHDVDYIVTSDRPATRTLLDLVHIPSQGRLIHYSRTNHTATREKLVDLLKGGRSLALVTTSGTPCVGDVGGELVRAMQASGVRVAPVPGASALLSALVVSGAASSAYESSDDADRDGDSAVRALFPDRIRGALENGSFFFGNMLPEPHGARLRMLRSVVGAATYPCVFYEVPRRLVMVLQDVAAVLPGRRVHVLHELTKLNESVHADTAEKLVAFYMRHEAHMLLKKGQVVLVIAGAGTAEAVAMLERESMRRRRLRKDVAELMDTGTQASAEKLKKCSSQKDRRKARLRRRRECLIREIEKEQERLQLSMSINRADADKL